MELLFLMLLVYFDFDICKTVTYVVNLCGYEADIVDVSMLMFGRVMQDLLEGLDE